MGHNHVGRNASATAVAGARAGDIAAGAVSGSAETGVEDDGVITRITNLAPGAKIVAQIMIIVAIFASALSTATSAQAYSIYGTVTLGEFKALPGVAVAMNFIDAQGQHVGGPRVTTNGYGAFELTAEPPPGFVPVKVRIYVTYPSGYVALGASTPCGYILSGMTAIEMTQSTCSGLQFKATESGSGLATPEPTATTRPTQVATPTINAVQSAKKGMAGPGGCVDVNGIDNLMQQMGVAWWYSWHYCPYQNVWQSSRYVPMVRAIHAVDRTQIEYVCTHIGYTGGYWLIGNEPDNEGQDDLPAEAAVEAYGIIANMILDVDPTAKIIMLGLQNADYYGIEYLRTFKARWYERWGTDVEDVVAGWHVHAYAIPSGDETQDAAIARVERWVLNMRNEVSGELWVTEYGNYQAADRGYVMRVMTEWMEHSVDRYAWFYAGDPAGDWSGTSLIHPWGELSNLGLQYARLPAFVSEGTPTPWPTYTPTRTATPAWTSTPTQTHAPTWTPEGVPTLRPTPGATCASELECEQRQVEQNDELLQLAHYGLWLLAGIAVALGVQTIRR